MSVHTIPLNDEREHVVGEDCWCEPRVEWIDPETGMPYPNGCMVIHHAADCRETSEEVTGESVDASHEWEIVEA